MADYQVKVTFAFDNKEAIDSGNNATVYTWTGTKEDISLFQRDVIVPTQGDLTTRSTNFLLNPPTE